MYYRKQQEKHRWKKLDKSTSWRRGVYYCRRRERYIKYSQPRRTKYWKSISNRKIRKYKMKSHKGDWYKKVFDVQWKTF